METKSLIERTKGNARLDTDQATAEVDFFNLVEAGGRDNEALADGSARLIETSTTYSDREFVALGGELVRKTNKFTEIGGIFGESN